MAREPRIVLPTVYYRIKLTDPLILYTYQGDGITVDSITIYHYDLMGYLVTETTETGDLIKDYIWQEGMTPLAQIDNSFGLEQIVYLYTDHLMTNRLATDDWSGDMEMGR